MKINHETKEIEYEINDIIQTRGFERSEKIPLKEKFKLYQIRPSYDHGILCGQKIRRIRLIEYPYCFLVFLYQKIIIYSETALTYKGASRWMQ